MLRPDTLVHNTLTTMARQRLGVDEQCCGAVIHFLNACAELEAALHQRLEQSGLTDSKFGILLALFTLHPSPACPADLACYTGFTRSSISEAVHELHAAGCVALERSPQDARTIEVRLTDLGQRAVNAAATAYLQALASVTQPLASGSLSELRQLASRFTEGAARLST